MGAPDSVMQTRSQCRMSTCRCYMVALVICALALVRTAKSSSCPIVPGGGSFPQEFEVKSGDFIVTRFLPNKINSSEPCKFDFKTQSSNDDNYDVALKLSDKDDCSVYFRDDNLWSGSFDDSDVHDAGNLNTFPSGFVHSGVNLTLCANITCNNHLEHCQIKQEVGPPGP